MDWTKKEIELIIQDYFAMLQLELEHVKFSKTEHRRKLLPLLNSRSNGSVEFKHQNISGVLSQMGLPFIPGYKPKFNFQGLLENKVSEFLLKNKWSLENLFLNFSDETVDKKEIKSVNFETLLDNPPSSSEPEEKTPRFQPIKINYLEREQNNRQLGENGELLIIDYEKWRLKRSGNGELAGKIEWVSKEQGDGLGYDILSRNIDGTDRYIEVKTTKLSKETPIYLSRNELSFASLRSKDFYLYRVFNFKANPQFFIKQGNYESFCFIQPQNFKGFFC